MTSSHVPLEVWADEGRRTAPAFSDIAAAIVTGRSAEAAAAVALGIARACAAAGARRVAVADLVGGVESLTPLDDQPGLLECLRDATPISDIGMPLHDNPDVYVLPSGRGPIAERWVFESARWDRLVAGFREVDALLLLVAPPGAPGLDVLIGRVDGVVAVDLPPAVVRAWPLIATVDEPELELPPIKPTPRDMAAIAAAPAPRRKRRVGRWVLAGLLVLLGVGYWTGTASGSRVLSSLGLGSGSQMRAALGLGSSGDGCGGQSGDAKVSPACRLDPAAEVGPVIPTPEPVPLAEVEMSVGALVNPGDSAIAARFSVELVAANTLESANSRLAYVEDRTVAKLVAPVLLPPGTTPWYRALVGAYASRDEAEAWLSYQRELGVLRSNIGRVLDAPFALLLQETTEDSLPLAIQIAQRQGIPAYALVQDDGRARVYVGAFETAGQALWYAAELKSRGLAPALAYRIGRAF